MWASGPGQPPARGQHADHTQPPTLSSIHPQEGTVSCRGRSLGENGGIRSNHLLVMVRSDSPQHQPTTVIFLLDKHYWPHLLLLSCVRSIFVTCCRSRAVVGLFALHTALLTSVLVTCWCSGFLPVQKHTRLPTDPKPPLGVRVWLRVTCQGCISMWHRGRADEGKVPRVGWVGA